MTGRKLMVGTNQRALEQAPRAFGGVRVNVPAHPFFFPVVHRLVLRVFVTDADVADVPIGVDGLGVIVDVRPTWWTKLQRACP